jgi:N-acetylated-alpha-linked acidic dipeptidase
MPNGNGTIGDNWNQQVGLLGSGSDFTVFLDHLGIPSIDIGFGGPPGGGGAGVYHSVYDSLYWQTQFGPGFDYYATLAQLWGLTVITMADSPILPFEFVDYAQTLKTAYLSMLQQSESLKIPPPFNSEELFFTIESFATAAQEALIYVCNTLAVLNSVLII